MPDVIDLSNLKKDSTQPDLDSLTEEQREALEDLAENTEPEAEAVATAFLVLVSRNGETMAVPDLHHKVVMDRMPTNDDIYGACAVIQKDIQISETSQNTAAFMQHMAMQAQQQMQAQQIASRLNLPKT